MIKNNKSLRGATLAEMMIVLGVLALISTIVISFVIMSNENVRTSRQKVDALNDIAVVESIMDNWLSSEMKYLSSDYFKDESKKDLDITVNYGDKINKLLFKNGKIQCYLNGSEVTYIPDTITKIETIIKNKDENDRIAICYITYELVLSNNDIREYTYSFVVYPYKFISEVDYAQNN